MRQHKVAIVQGVQVQWFICGDTWKSNCAWRLDGNWKDQECAENEVIKPAAVLSRRCFSQLVPGFIGTMGLVHRRRRRLSHLLEVYLKRKLLKKEIEKWNNSTNQNASIHQSFLYIPTLQYCLHTCTTVAMALWFSPWSNVLQYALI